MDSAIWDAGQRLLHYYGDMAENECSERASYYAMMRDHAAAAHWRQQRDVVLRLRRGEQPPLKLKEAIIAGRFHDFLAQREAGGIKAAVPDIEIAEVIRAAIRQRLLELQRPSLDAQGSAP